MRRTTITLALFLLMSAGTNVWLVKSNIKSFDRELRVTTELIAVTGTILQQKETISVQQTTIDKQKAQLASAAFSLLDANRKMDHYDVLMRNAGTALNECTAIVKGMRNGYSGY